MSESKHTPGPWTAHWSKYQDGVFLVQAGMPSNRVLAVFDGDGDGPDDQSIADARLIAAAPEMFDALARLLAQWEAFEAGYGNQEEAYYKLAKYARPHWEAARAAIAKAEARP